MILSYPSISNRLKPAATQVFVKELMTFAGTTKISELHQYLFRIRKIDVITQQEINGKFWYKKLNGHPIKRVYKILEIGRTFPIPMQYLEHPIWRLASSPIDTIEQLATLMSFANQKTKGILFSRSKFFFTKPHIFKNIYSIGHSEISNNISLDGLLMRCFMYLIKHIQYKRREILYENTEILRCFLCLFAFVYDNVDPWELYEGIKHSVLLGKEQTPQTPVIHKYTNTDLLYNSPRPKFIHDIQSNIELNLIIKAYKAHSIHLVQQERLENTLESKLTYFSKYYPHTIIQAASEQ